MRLGRYWYRRWKLGFDPRDLWSLDFALFKWLLPRVKAFRQSEWRGCPCVPPMCDGVEGPFDYDKWDEILDEIIWFLEFMIKEGDWPFPSDPKYRRVMRGYGLLIKWLPAMWE